MASAMRKVGEYLGLVEQAEYDDAGETYSDETYADDRPAVRERSSAPVRPAPVAQLDERRDQRRRPAPTPNAGTDVSRIETVTPRTYNDARTVGENFRNGVPVIMNLSEIEDDDAKRLVDFAAGLVFSVHGTINRITAKVFLLSPSNITVTDEDKQRIAAGGFYDQR